MKLTKEYLEGLYSSMSIDAMAIHLKMAKSTLYYHMRKLGVNRRTKSEAQQRHLESGIHQRLGVIHSNEAKQRIARGTRKFWESEQGAEQKKRLGDLRRSEWEDSSNEERRTILNRLQLADRPTPGNLSRFGNMLADFLVERETSVKTGMRITARHISDIILEDRKVVIELLLPVKIYGQQQEQKIVARYDRLASELRGAGYRLVVIEDKSNSLSLARCQRVYDQLTTFFINTNIQRLTIVS